MAMVSAALCAAAMALSAHPLAKAGRSGSRVARRRSLLCCSMETPSWLTPPPGSRLPAAAAAYLSRPSDISDAVLPAGCSSAQDVVLIFHGRGGPDRETSDLEARFIQQDRAAGLTRLVAVHDWTRWLEAAERIGYVGQAIGEKLGRDLAATNPQLRSLHVVGTSAGAFAADQLCSAYVRAAGQTRARVRLTLTDPFTARGGEALGDGWGLSNFGRDADFAEHYLNTDDPVPSTNLPLRCCFCYDVTGCRERSSFPPPDTGNFFADIGLRLLGYHNWPMGYLARHYITELDSDGRVVHPTHDTFPRGTVVRVA